MLFKLIIVILLFLVDFRVFAVNLIFHQFDILSQVIKHLCHSFVLVLLLLQLRFHLIILIIKNPELKFSILKFALMQILL